MNVHEVAGKSRNGLFCSVFLNSKCGPVEKMRDLSKIWIRLIFLKQVFLNQNF